MSNGFLGYGASLMLDVVVCALVLVVPTLAYSIYVVKIRRNYVRHRNVQVALGAVLLVIGAGTTPAETVEHAIAQLGGVDSIFGIVLNRVDESRILQANYYRQYSAAQE